MLGRLREFFNLGCRACDVLKDEVADLRAERNLLRQELLNALRSERGPNITASAERSPRERTQPVPMAATGWGSIRSKLEGRHKKVAPTNEDKIQEYWAKKNSELEAKAGITGRINGETISTDTDASVG